VSVVLGADQDEPKCTFSNMADDAKKICFKYVSTNQNVSRQKKLFRLLDIGSLCAVRRVDKHTKLISELTVSRLTEFEAQSNIKLLHEINEV